MTCVWTYSECSSKMCERKLDSAPNSPCCTCTWWVPEGDCYKIESSKYISYDRLRIYREKDCVCYFIDELFKDDKEIHYLFNLNKTLVFTDANASDLIMLLIAT